ncbi:hypothetical protein WN943_028036 [Citrus x changshan-huyou]
MPFLDEASRSEVIGNPEGLRVSVWDCDTNSMHCLVFKKWATSKSYVLINHWTKDFVRRSLSIPDSTSLFLNVPRQLLFKITLTSMLIMFMIIINSFTRLNNGFNGQAMTHYLGNVTPRSHNG